MYFACTILYIKKVTTHVTRIKFQIHACGRFVHVCKFMTKRFADTSNVANMHASTLRTHDIGWMLYVRMSVTYTFTHTQAGIRWITDNKAMFRIAWCVGDVE